MIPVVLAIADQIVEAYSRIGLVMAFHSTITDFITGDTLQYQ